MSAPDELRQLADRLSFMAQHAPVGYGNWADDLRAAAVALRHHANLLDAIGDPDELRWHRWHCEETGQGDDLRELLVRIADAADAADAEAAAVAEGAEDAEDTE